MTGSSQFSLIGSSMLKSHVSGTSEASSSGVLVAASIKRGWDWRKGLRVETSGAEVLTILRYALATELGRVWVGGDT